MSILLSNKIPYEFSNVRMSSERTFVVHDESSLRTRGTCGRLKKSYGILLDARMDMKNEVNDDAKRAYFFLALNNLGVIYCQSMLVLWKQSG